MLSELVIPNWQQILAGHCTRVRIPCASGDLARVIRAGDPCTIDTRSPRQDDTIIGVTSGNSLSNSSLLWLDKVLLVRDGLGLEERCWVQVTSIELVEYAADCSAPLREGYIDTAQLSLCYESRYGNNSAKMPAWLVTFALFTSSVAMFPADFPSFRLYLPDERRIVYSDTVMWQSPDRHQGLGAFWRLLAAQPGGSSFLTRGTSLRDQGGYEIFEGDLLAISTQRGSLSGRVVYDGYRWRIETGGTDVEFLLETIASWPEHVQIIGNIYEHPERFSILLSE